MTSYSQDREDIEVVKVFVKDGVLEHGTLLEIGAWHPTLLSNSRALIEAGWDALLVDVSPTAAATLIREYKGCDRVQVLQAGITPAQEHVMCFDITENALSTSEAKIVNQWGADGGYYGRLWLPSLSVGKLIDQFFGGRTIDFASIDTEGTSVEIAIALIETDWRPRALLVEHDDRLVALQSAAHARGYIAKWTNGVNVLLVKE